MKYKILTAETPQELEEKVRDAIYEGWLPKGGIAVAQYVKDTVWKESQVTVSIFVQAMAQ